MRSLVIPFLVLFVLSAHADVKPQPLSIDKRIKVVQYTQNNVVTIKAFYHVATLIQLSEHETLDPDYPFLLGDSTAWQIQPFGVNGFYIKPVRDAPNTNLTVRTDKRLYFFALKGEKLPVGQSIDPDLSNFAVLFEYPDEKRQKFLEKQLAAHEGKEHYENTVVESSDPVAITEVNLDYKFSGNREIRPDAVFDHNGKTYFKFAAGGLIPAIFAVVDRDEVLVNYRIDGRFVVVDRTSDKFTLTHGRKKAQVKRI